MSGRIKSFVFMLIVFSTAITFVFSTSAQSTDSVSSPHLTLLWQTAFDKDSVLIEPDYLTVDSQGSSYITQLSSGVMKKFDADGKFVLAIQAATQDLTGVGVDSQGNILLGGCEVGRIQKFDSSGTALTDFVSDVPWCTTGIVVDAQDWFYVFTGFKTGEAYIQKFDSSAQLLTKIGAPESGEGAFGLGSSGTTLAVDQDGNVYATDPSNNRILKFDSDGKFIFSMVMPDDGKPVANKLVFRDDPYGIAVDGQGNIYVSSSHFLRKLDSEGNILAQWPTTEGDLNRAGRVAVDSEGNIFIVAEADVVGVNNVSLKALVLKKFQQ